MARNSRCNERQVIQMAVEKIMEVIFSFLPHRRPNHLKRINLFSDHKNENQEGVFIRLGGAHKKYYN